MPTADYGPLELSGRARVIWERGLHNDPAVRERWPDECAYAEQHEAEWQRAITAHAAMVERLGIRKAELGGTGDPAQPLDELPGLPSLLSPPRPPREPMPVVDVLLLLAALLVVAAAGMVFLLFLLYLAL